MTTVENIVQNITIETELGQAQKAILESLALTAKRTEELFKIELMNKVDNDANEKIPVKKLIQLESTIGVHTKNTPFQKILETTQLQLHPILENASCLVSKIIPRLFTYSIYILFDELEDIYKTINRRYIFTDRTAIYKLEFNVCAYKVPCPSLLPSISNVYCIAESLSTVDIDRIDFPSLAYFYQRQLTAHGIDEKALNYLFHEFKNTYYMLKRPPHNLYSK